MVPVASRRKCGLTARADVSTFFVAFGEGSGVVREGLFDMVEGLGDAWVVPFGFDEGVCISVFLFVLADFLRDMPFLGFGVTVIFFSAFFAEDF